MSTSLRLALVITVAACAPTATIESTWHLPSSPQLTNVATLSSVADPGLRRTAEDALAQQLQQHGVHAVPGYAVLSDQDLGNHEQIAASLRAKGFDGVVTMRLVNANQKLEVVPGGFGPYWGGAWGMGGEVVPETVVRIEVNAYSLADQQMVFSAMSKSIDPDTAKQLISSVAQVSTNKLAQEGVIAAPRAASR